MKRWVVVWSILAVSSACGPMSGDDGAADAAGSEGSTATTFQPTGTATGTPGIACEDLLSEEDCRRVVSENNLPCEWGTFRNVDRQGDVCTDLPDVSMCVELNGWTTEGGCQGDPNCEGLTGEALYLPLEDGSVLLAVQCGGSAPTSFTGCETVLPDVDPPECACACPTFPDAGGSGSSTSG